MVGGFEGLSVNDVQNDDDQQRVGEHQLRLETLPRTELSFVGLHILVDVAKFLNNSSYKDKRKAFIQNTKTNKGESEYMNDLIQETRVALYEFYPLRFDHVHNIHHKPIARIS